MDYANMAGWQVIREMLHRNPADLTVLQIANLLSLNEKTVYKWGEDPEYSGTVIPKKYEISFSNVTKDKRLFEWKAHQIGYHLTPIQIGLMIEGDIMSQFLEAGDYLGKSMGEVNLAMGDGRLDDNDKTKLRALLGVLIRHCQGIYDSLNK